MAIILPETGEFFVKNGKVYEITEFEVTDYIEDELAYNVYAKRDPIPLEDLTELAMQHDLEDHSDR